MKRILKRKATEETEDSDSSMEFLVSGVDMEKRRIEIRSYIDANSVSIVSRALIKMAEISHEPIEILLSSGGGSVYDGLGLYDMIRHNPCEIKIIASGQIMSMGFIVFLAGDQRAAMPHTTFMMHSLSYSTPESKIVKHHEVEVNESKRLNNLMLEIMAERTNRTKKYWYRTVLLQDRYFNLTEALELGIIKVPTNKVQNVKKKVQGRR